MAGYTYNLDDLPSERTFRYYTDTTDYSYVAQLNADGFKTAVGNMFYREVEENIYTGRLDYKRQLPKGMYVKAGGYYEEKDRNYFSRLYYYDLQESSTTVVPGRVRLSTLPILNADSLMNSWVRDDGQGLTLTKTLDFYNYRFSSSTTLYAGYIGLNVPLLNNKLSVYGGVRFESFNQSISPIGLDSTTTEVEREFLAPDTSTKDFFPSANLTWNLKDNMKVRASYGVTVNRPFEREVSGGGSYDFTQGITLVGYPNLKRSKIQNADMRIERYGGSGEILALGVFYKKFRSPIELVTDELPDINDQLFLAENFFTSNTESATNYGIELEVRKNLSFINPALENFSLIFNASFLRSRVQLADSLERAFYEKQYDAIRIARYENAKGVKRSLTGTSPYLVNFSLYYDNKQTKTTLAIQYNIIGPRIIIPPVIQILQAQDPSQPPGVLYPPSSSAPEFTRLPDILSTLQCGRSYSSFLG
ncbi:MAG: TonB-dependent receptor [Bacteroidia bacterium]|nr:TonB-dependent receptor [Bacteroidia bacterium]